MATIKKYTPEYQDALFALIESEGEDWEYHLLAPNRQRYIQSLAKSETFVVFEGEKLVGYARTLDDYEVFVVDLLVHKDYRGKSYGQKLMEYVCEQFSDKDVFVLGADDVLPYYNKLGYRSAGIVYQVND